MKKRLVSIILTVFLVLSMMPFAAFADDTIVCPACGGSVTKQERRLLTAHDDFYKCDKCGKWAWVNKLGSLSLFSVGDQQILDAADSSAIINFSFNNGKLIPAEKAPSGIGRKDLPGYADDNGTALVDSSGRLTLSTYHLATYFDTSISCKHKTKGQSNSSYSGTFVCDLESSEPVNIQVESADSRNFGGTVTFVWTFTAPVNGWYSLASPVKITGYQIDSEGVRSTLNGNFISLWEKFGFSEKTFKCSSLSDKTYFSSGTKVVLQITGDTSYRDFSYNSVSGVYKNITCIAPIMAVEPVSTVVNQQTNITINNNTWNGNIYVDNSTNLTYIYPQYTTINDKSETVTNISTNPIIYNNETKQYYTYDTVTNNYYYITYETSPTPTPSPSPAPAPTWTPGGGATRGGGVGRHPSDTDAADWTLHYYVLNNRRYDAYYALKKTEVDTDTKLPWVDNKKYISTTQIPIANGQYTVSVPDGVYWRVWSWDEASQTLTGVNSSNWHSTINNFLFNATGEYIFEFCKADGSDFNTAKDVTLKLKNDKITDYEDGGTIVEEPTPSPSPGPTETPSPTEPPIPTATPKPGGGTVPTPGGDSSGGNSGSSDSGWNPFKWLTDLLKDLIEDILKGLWKLLTSIFGFILWLLSLLFKLFPWMPNSGILALCAGVVVVTVIRIIKFITGR